MKLPWTKDTEFLVIVNHYDHDISWTEKLELPFVVYHKDKPEEEPFNAVNKGKSETNLLKFIFQFYDDLPKNIINVHQYEEKWYHEGSLVDILNDPMLKYKYELSQTPGYYSLNNYPLCDAPKKVKKMVKSGWWSNTMEKYFGDMEGYGNFTLGKQGGAQFIVGRDRIHSLPKEFYENMYYWIIENVSDEITVGIDPETLCRLAQETDFDLKSNYYMSRYLEWTWELIFATYKEGEEVYTENGVAAFYGSSNYYVNVTKIFVKYFLKGNSVSIPRSTRFHPYFGDPVFGNKKTLKVYINGFIFELPEVMNKKFSIDLDNEMELLGKNYNTDKVVWHKYDQIYPLYIEKFYEYSGAMLEIGIASESSLKMWLDLFPNMHIYGIDIGFEDKGERFTVFKADQSSSDDLDTIKEKITEPLYFINDDGSHIPEHQLLTFNKLFPKLEIGGVYIIEDVETSYWKKGSIYGYPVHYGFRHPQSIIEIFKDVADAVNADVCPKFRSELQHLEYIKSITFARNCIIITKKIPEKRCYPYSNFL
jgi:hypothetical protein